jgi:hypothetical protein
MEWRPWILEVRRTTTDRENGVASLIGKILDHLGLSSPEAAKPPPQPRPHGLIVPTAKPRPLERRRSATARLPGSDIALASADAHRPARRGAGSVAFAGAQP